VHDCKVKKYVYVIGKKLSEILHPEDSANFTQQTIAEFANQPLIRERCFQTFSYYRVVECGLLTSESKKLKNAPTSFFLSILTGVVYQVTRTARTQRIAKSHLNQLSSDQVLPSVHLTFFFHLSKHCEYRTLHSFPEGIIVDADIRYVTTF
jgi:hypothetical protein